MRYPDHDGRTASIRQGRIIEAVKSTVPESMWGDMVRQLDGIVEADERNDHQIEDFDPGDDEYGLLECAEVDDDLWRVL